MTKNLAPAPAVPAPSGPITFKDWRLDIRASAESANGVCVAATTGVLGTGPAAVKHDLEIVLDKSGTHPIEVRIRPASAVAGIAAFKVAIDAKQTKVYSFAKVASVDAGQDVFWNIPRGTADLLDVLKRDIRFDVTGDDGTAKGQKLTFSLRGSTPALAELQKRCNGGAALASDGFERAFLPSVVATVDPSKLTPSDTDHLRALLAQGLAAWHTSTTTQAQIGALTNQFLAQLNELAKLKSNLDQLTQKDVVNLQNRRTTAQNVITTAQAQIDQIRPQITNYEAQLVQANQAYEAAYNVLKPYIDRHDSLVADIQNARAELSQANDDLTQIDSAIANASQKINDLNSQLSSIQSQYSQAQWDVNQAQSAANSAYNDDNNFDANREFNQRVSQDNDLNNIQNRLNNLAYSERQAENDLNNAQNRLNQAQSRYGDISSRMSGAERDLERASSGRDHAQSALQQCQGTPGADCSIQNANLDAAQREVERARNEVSSLSNDYNRAQSELSGLQSDVNRAQNEIDSVRSERSSLCSRRDSRINEIKNEVESIRSNLAARYDAARTNLANAQARIDRLNSDARDIQNVLPQWQAELNREQSARSGAVSAIRAAQRDVSNAISARDSYDAAVGYAAKEQDVSHASDTVDQIKSILAQMDSDIKKRQRLISDNQAELVTVEKLMTQTLATIRQKQDRSVEVEKMLEPYDQQKAALEQTKAVADQQLSDARTGFAAGLPQAAPVSAPVPALVSAKLVIR